MTPMFLLLFIVIVFVFFGGCLIDHVQRMIGSTGCVWRIDRSPQHPKYTGAMAALAVSRSRKTRFAVWLTEISAPVAVMPVVMSAPATAIAPLKR